MFKYTKEVIINSLLADQDAYGSTLTLARVQAEPGLLRILRAGEYKKENIVDTRIYKTPGIIGSTGSVAINFTQGGGTIFPQIGLYRMVIYIGMNNKFLADYAQANWYAFGKQILVEFEVTTANNNVADISKLIASAVKDAVPYNNVFARTSIVANVLTVSLTDPYAHIKGVEFEFYEPTQCDSCLGNYEALDVPAGNIVITKNTEPFGTGAWIQENLRFPSYPNVRYAALYADEYPIQGQIYTEYSFEYSVARPNMGGLSAVGQKIETVTRHVYYVLNSLVNDFEDLIDDAFGDNVVVENNSIFILNARTIANDAVTVQLIADTYPVDSGATITWRVTNAAGTTVAAPANVTLTATGQLTAAAGAVVGTKFFITATSDNTDYKPVTKEFKVIAG